MNQSTLKQGASQLDNKLELVEYSSEEIKEFEDRLQGYKESAGKLILNEYYDYVDLTDVERSVLRQIMNSETWKDLNTYSWNSGILERVLNNINAKMKIMEEDDLYVGD